MYHHKIRTILKVMFGIAILALIFAWVVRGGPGRLGERLKEFATPNVTWSNGIDLFSLRLPWQPENLFPTMDISKDGAYGFSEEAELEYIENSLDELERKAREVREFGTPSPFSESVQLMDISGAAKNGSPQEEYLQLAASYRNERPVSLAGWSLQSVVSGVRVYIPGAASPFVLGAINHLDPVALAPGEVAIVTSGFSPTGASFRENQCTGYLAQFQTFNPPLAERCPEPEDELPLTAENLRVYGDACIDLMHSLPTCRFYTGLLPQGTSPACSAFIGDALSYNGCLARHRHEADFHLGMWRIYLSAPAELWRNSHDVIRLLDAEGRTVDLLTY